MTIIIGILFVVVGGLIAWGGVSGNLAKMLGAVTNVGTST